MNSEMRNRRSKTRCSPTGGNLNSTKSFFARGCGLERLLAFFLIIRYDTRDIVHAVGVVQIHETHALGIPTRDADAFHRHANHHAKLGDQPQLIVREDFLDRHGIPRLFRAMDGDDALAATLLHAVLVDR